jgi:hypothetical protein
MTTVHTHYDNLKVTRNAPPEVIRAAYRSLSQKYHPDMNPGKPDAERVMKLINEAYEVLSDPLKRQQHDRWIALEESNDHRQPDPTPAPGTRGQGFTVDETLLKPRKARVGVPFELGQLVDHVLRNAFWYLVCSIALVIYLVSPDNKKASTSPYSANPPSSSTPASNPFDRFDANTAARLPADTKTMRFATAPNGSEWPFIAGYVDGYPLVAQDGLSTVTVDNSRNDSAVFVKLVSIDGPSSYPVRQFYIPANDTFTVMAVRQGSYDVRYRDLTSGALLRSEPFTLEEAPTNGGTRYSNMTMTLYKVQNGNMKTYPLGENEF